MKSEFAKRMGKLRREKGLSQQQAAAEFGVSQALLSHYENGVREPKYEFMSIVCDYYGVTADYLLGRTKERRNEATILIDEVSKIVNSLEKVRATEEDLICKLIELINGHL